MALKVAEMVIAYNDKTCMRRKGNGMSQYGNISMALVLLRLLRTRFVNTARFARDMAFVQPSFRNSRCVYLAFLTKLSRKQPSLRDF